MTFIKERLRRIVGFLPFKAAQAVTISTAFVAGSLRIANPACQAGLAEHPVNKQADYPMFPQTARSCNSKLVCDRKIVILSLVLAVVSPISRGPAQEPTAPAAAPSPKVNPETEKWLETVEIQWIATLKKEAAGPYAEAKAKLDEQYLSGIDANATKASAAGNLDLTLVWRKERERFNAEEKVPVEEDSAAPTELKQLRAAWRTQLARLEKDRADRTKVVLAKFDQVLAQAQAQLTQKQRIDDAVLVKRKREEVAAAWTKTVPSESPEAAASPANNAPAVASPPPVDKPPMGNGTVPTLARCQAENTAEGKLVPGEAVLSDTAKYRWVTIPPTFNEFRFTKAKGSEPTLNFKVLSDGRVYLMCTNRFIESGSKDSWTGSALTEEKLQAKGWHRERNIEIKSDEPGMVYLVFSRNCRAGEDFSIRTEKYRSPMLLMR